MLSEKALAGPLAEGAAGRRAARAQEEGLLRPPPGQAAQHRRDRGAPAPPRAGRAPGVQARRHLRGRVRHPHRLHVFDLRGRVRGRDADRNARRSWSSAAVRTASARASSSTTAACHAALALREDGYETIMVNCNPETVSTDYDTSDRLYFEPITLEDLLEIVHIEKPVRRDRAVRRPDPAEAAPRRCKRTACRSSAPRPDMIDAAEDRERFQKLLNELGLQAAAQPHRAHAANEAVAWPAEIGYPLVVRPSYVLGGRAMEIVHEQKDLERYMREAVQGLERVAGAARPLPQRRHRGGRRRAVRRQAGR